MSTVLAPTTTTTPPPVANRPGPQPFRWTIEQYRELGKLGISRA